MDDCIFCKIVEGKMPSYKVYEDELFLAFLDRFPTVKGSVLVIPKKHYQWTYDVPEFETYWGTVLKVTKALQKSLSPAWTNYYTYGYIPHAHIHILPREGKPDSKENSVVPREKISLDEREFQTIAELIAKNI